uniref:Predicted 3'-5' exonuclease PolB-like domain-containing protein n=1 Tax=uncultured marine virus TaxID=186617 RepID=A0A0F7L380_9VIRU|nr:hypothetical protein [uncultured marine virus]
MIILDIETKPQASLVELFSRGIKAPKTYKDPAKIKEYIENKKAGSKKGMSVDTDYADILCVGVYDTELNGGTAYVVEPDQLPEILEKEQMVVTFNGKKFDIPLIIKYGIKHGLDLPYARLKLMMKRYDNSRHIDLMEELGQGNFRSLDEYLQIYLGISKKPIDFETASDEEIKEHCMEDIVNTYKLYKKFSKLF